MYSGNLLAVSPGPRMGICKPQLLYIDAQVLDYNLLATLVARTAYMLPDFKRQLKAD